MIFNFEEVQNEPISSCPSIDMGKPMEIIQCRCDLMCPNFHQFIVCDRDQEELEYMQEQKHRCYHHKHPCPQHTTRQAQTPLLLSQQQRLCECDDYHQQLELRQSRSADTENSVVIDNNANDNGNDYLNTSHRRLREDHFRQPVSNLCSETLMQSIAFKRRLFQDSQASHQHNTRSISNKNTITNCKSKLSSFSLSCLLSLSLFTLCSALPDSSVETFSFPDGKQENFVRDLSDYHISWPSRVDESTQFLTHNTHANHDSQRNKRDVNETKQDSSHRDNSNNGDVLHYKIPLHADKEVIVKVKKTDTLLSPSAVVERKVSQWRNISDSVFSLLDHHRGCHVTGHVLNDAGSRVALSACQGLRGFVQHDGVEYLIEPVKGHTGRSNGAQPHLVYKRSSLPDHMDIGRSRDTNEDAASSCGVQEKYDKIIASRERWERHRRSKEATSSSSSTSSSHGRRKRSISTEKHVETLVVVDTDMVRYYENEDIETYVLTVMNMVATLFHDASIGNAINIVIVRILLLQDPDEDLTILNHADKTLRNFCKWQKRINFRDDDHPNHHDVALLMTRKNICSRMNEPCSTLGLAQVAGLCQPHKTCSINEDTGLSLAWTVAHEVGHNFGMKHDIPSVGCVSNEQVQYVMAPHLTWDQTPSRWSNCSRNSITKFLDRNWGYCLDDTPGHHDFKYPQLPAGTMYDSDHQCALLYGQGAERCNGIEVLENICTTLWCRVNNKCSTKLQAAAVGTICGADKWCFNGACVEIGERPQAINGQWGEWSEWTSCTRTCGAGVNLSERHCNHPPPSNGGKYCTGERKRYRICNTDSCPEDAPSFRRLQCAEFNKIPYMGTKYEWEDVSTPESPCQLHCKPKKMYFSVMLKDIVTDGTPCVIGSRHMCITGRCRHIGCDWVIDSNAIEDQCGVCYGDGSTCKTIKQQFNETKKLGYVEATVIPTGARNIRVEEMAEVSNFLALRNEKGEYYLNGHWFIQWSGDYELAGTVLHYKRLGNKESFNVPGPTKEPLHIMLLMQTHNPGVEFEYTVPKENATDTKKPEFHWEVTGWSHCTVSCGGGTQRAAVVCKEQEMGVVDDIHCNISSKPDDQLRDCNVHLCPARWWTGPWQHCSVTCGDEGIHRRTVICVRSLGSDEQIALEDSACGNLDKPLEMDVCHRTKPCPGLGTWETTEWSNCTRPCNGGVQFRKVVCVGGEVCEGEKPKLEQPCNEERCPDQVEEAMMNIHEGGIEERKVTGRPSGASSYPSIPRPSGRILNINSESSNNEKSNIAFTGDNLIDNSDLNDKNVLIGTEEKENPVNSIINNDVESGEDVNESPPSYNDNVAGSKANKNKYHHRRHLHRHRQHHHQSGSKENIPTVIKEGGASKSDGSVQSSITVSSTQRTTSPVSRVYRWRSEDWQKCSVHCGSGVRTRKVFCVEENANMKVDVSMCDIHSKPSVLQDCFSSKCLAWQMGEWGECSATCGYAVQTRRVACSSGPGWCDPDEKPEVTRVCSHLKECISWVFGDWSQCSKSCDEGIQERLVQCVNLTSQQLSNGCGWDSKPHTKQKCNLRKCPENKAALRVSCESNEMSFKVCRMLKKVGLCHKQYVQAKCCRTCQDHRRKLPKRSRIAK